ncbi:MAG TPA: TorF family putative porin [Sphingomicrobium sp.]|nr:TorF family putative porin [Sphingomicrobium sp.]
MPAPRSRAQRAAVTVPAPGGRTCRARGSLTRSAACLSAFFISSSLAAPVAAEVGATVSLFSDDRFRGYSLSGGRPVAVLDFAYDNPSGFYAEASGTGVLQNGDPSPFGFELSGGYARRLRSGTTLDLGVTNSTYSHYSGSESARSYAEIYAGISRGGLSSRFFFSPHYSESGLWTAYGEVNGSVSPASKWSLDGHVGMLVPLKSPAGDERYRTAFDWRLGVSRELGPLSLHLSLNEGERGRIYYGDRSRRGRALVIGASCVL